MATIISASIDLTKIVKSKIKEHANGSKYYNIQIFINDEPDKYGNNVSVQDNQTKEEREAKDKKNYLGNGKVLWEGNQKKSDSVTETKSETPADDDLPF